jgi:hypothetical protein
MGGAQDRIPDRRPKEGAVADRSNQLIVAALSRAAAGGAPLHGSKALPGLFPATSAGKQAAQRCREEGYLTTLTLPQPAPKGRKPATAPWGLTEKGFAFLLTQASPREVLEDFVRALEARESQIAEVQQATREVRDGLLDLKTAADHVLRRLAPSAPADGSGGNLNALFEAFVNRGRPAVDFTDCTTAILQRLGAWQASGASEDCPLPELFRQVGRDAAPWTIGQFHDALRRLHVEGQVYLHPWTGPLYDLPEPPYALLVGHEIAYYASVRA